MESSYYDQDSGLIKFKYETKDGTPKKIYVDSKSARAIEDQACNLIQTIVIMS